jgi:acyl-coenzyme A thioesterase PaaI-like protein
VITEISEEVSHTFQHDWCLMCGKVNPWSLRLEFTDIKNGVRALFQPHRGLSGYEGILHGGVISALLDAAMTHCLFHQKIKAVTVDLNIRFLKPVSCQETLEITAWILSDTPPLYSLKGELVQNKILLAWAEARFMQMANGQ